ncbi:MAG: hypothetical protein WCZ08_03000 [Parcubacteria group bacterium]|jgi:hypothetical protein
MGTLVPQWFARIKAKRQIRDAFNKCEDLTTLGEIGEILIKNGFLKMSVVDIFRNTQE